MTGGKNRYTCDTLARRRRPNQAGGAGAAAAAAAAERRCLKLPPPATLLPLGAKGKTPRCRRHFFMAATCLSHALYGSRPFELTTRCEQGTGGGRGVAPGRRTGWGRAHAGVCSGKSNTQQPAQTAGMHGNRPAARQRRGRQAAVAPLSPPPGSTFDAPQQPQGKALRRGSAPPADEPMILVKRARDPSRCTLHVDRRLAVRCSAAAARPLPLLTPPTPRRNLSGNPTCVSRLLQMAGLAALLRKQCSRVPSARPQRLQRGIQFRLAGRLAA